MARVIAVSLLFQLILDLYWTSLPPLTPTKLKDSFEFSLTYGVVRKLKSIRKKMDHARLVQLSCYTCGMISARACQP